MIVNVSRPAATRNCTGPLFRDVNPVSLALHNPHGVHIESAGIVNAAPGKNDIVLVRCHRLHWQKEYEEQREERQGGDNRPA